MNTVDSRHADRGVSRRRRTLVASGSSALFLSAALLAQTAPAPTGRASGASPQTATAPAAVPNAGIDSVKTQLKATDAEWKVIGPKLQAVVTARQTVMTYATAGGGATALFGGGGPDFLGRGGRGGPGGPGGFGRDSLNGPGGPGGPFGRGGPDFPPGVDPATFFAGRGGPGGPPPGFDPAALPANTAGGAPFPMAGTNNAITAALDELKTTLTNSASTPEQVKVKLAAVRAERKKAESSLAAAQKALLLLITPAQEATLVSLGYLD